MSLGASPSNVGIADGNTGNTGAAVLASVANGSGSTADISNVTTATAAVSALAVYLSERKAARKREPNYETGSSQVPLTEIVVEVAWAFPIR